MTFALIAPAALATVVLTAIYRLFGPHGRAYATAEGIDTFLHYGVNVGTVFGTEMTWPVLWILCPFSTVYMAVMKPFNTRLYRWVVGAGHTVLAVLYVVRGDAGRAPVALGVGVVSYAVYTVIAHQGRRALTAEAERNVAQARLNEAILDQARRQVATTLRERIGRGITALASELDPKGAEHASSALLGLEEVVGAQTRSPGPSSPSELLRRIDEKCRPLCADAVYESSLSGREGCSLDAARAGAVVLRVADDGSGLTPERFARATGGLENAARWLRECGGAIDLEPRAGEQASTTVRCRLPSCILRG